MRTPRPKRAAKTAPAPARTLRDDDPWLLVRLIESINSGIVVLDGRDRVVMFNAAAEAITGFQRDDLRGQPFADALGPRNHRTLLSEMALSTSPRENHEVTLVARNDVIVPIGYTSSPLVDEAGDRVGTVIIFKDLTDIFNLRQEMQRREHLATVGEMTALIAHEIRNPLAAMQTAAETLKGELGYDEEKTEFLNIIVREIKRVANLVADFFTYVRPVEPKLEPLDIHELLDVLVFIEGAKMKRAGIAINCDYAADVPLVRADRNLLQQALLNIILNAFQATATGGSVTIVTGYETIADGGQLTIAIRDTGEGIARDSLDRIFKPFHSTRTKGIGLGLAITDRLVKAMNGRIDLQSERGHGSTFTIRLPVVPA